MHNIRKIKKKRKNRVLNPEQMAQQRLFEISRFQDEEDHFGQVDMFIDKLQPKEIAFDYCRPKKSRVKEDSIYAKLSAVDFDKRARMSENIEAFKQFRSFSTDMTGKRPIALINYIVLDGRDEKRYSHYKSMPQSLSKIKHKMNKSKNKSQQRQYEEPSIINLTPKNSITEFIKKSNNKLLSNFHIKNVKLFNKYSGLYRS